MEALAVVALIISYFVGSWLALVGVKGYVGSCKFTLKLLDIGIFALGIALIVNTTFDIYQMFGTHLSILAK